MAPEDDHNTDSLVWRLGMIGKTRRCLEYPWAHRYAQATHTSHPPSPTVRPRTPCRGRPLPPRPPAGWDFGTDCISGQNIKALMKAPWESAANSLRTESWADGWWCGWNMWLWSSLCTQGLSQHPHISPNMPNIRPKDSICMESRHHPSGVSSDT